MRLFFALASLLAILGGCTTRENVGEPGETNSNLDTSPIPAYEFAVEALTNLVSGTCLPLSAALKQAGTAAAPNSAVTVPLGFAAFSDSACRTTVQSVQFESGQSNKVLYYLAPSGSPSVSFPASPPTPYRQISPLPQFNITGSIADLAPAKVGIRIANVVTTGSCTPAVLLMLNAGGFAVPADILRTISLSATPGSDQFFTSADCTGSSVSSQTIPAGELSRIIYFRPVGSLHDSVLGVSSNPLTSEAVSLTVVAGPPAALNLAFSPAQFQLPTGVCFGIRATLRDALGNDTAPATPYQVSLSFAPVQSGSSFYSSATCVAGTETTTVSIASGSTSSLFYLASSAPYSGVVAALAPPLPLAALPLTVVSSPPTQISWEVVSSPLTLGAGSCVELNFALRNAAGSITSAQSAYTLVGTFSGSVNGRFYRSAGCSSSDSTDVVLGVGQSTGSIFVKVASTLTSFNTLLSTPGLTAASITTNVVGGNATKLALPAGAAMVLNQNECTPVEIQLQDASSLPTALATSTAVGTAMAGNPGYNIYASSACTTPVSSLTIEAYSRAVRGYVKTTSPSGTATVTNTAVGLTQIVLNLSVTAGPPSNAIANSKSLVSGTSTTCAITSTSGVKCWGYNNYGQVGNGTTIGQYSAVTVAVPGVVTKLAGGWAHFCALNNAGAMYCWGYNGYGQLGNGTTTYSTTPVAVPALQSGVVDIAVGNVSTFAVKSDGTLYSWGYNGYGQLGLGHVTTHLTPSLVAGSYVAVNASHEYYYSSDHVCAITASGNPFCWGYNGYRNSTGTNSVSYQSTPYDLTSFTGTVDLIIPMPWRTAFIKNNVLKAWGYNGHGQLGDGTQTDQITPAAVLSGGDSVTSVNGSDHTTCHVRLGKAYCYGNNTYEKLGTLDSGASNFKIPTEVFSFQNGVQEFSSAGYWFTCAIKDYVPWCWGYNGNGELGLSSTGNPGDFPARVLGF